MFGFCLFSILCFASLLATATDETLEFDAREKRQISRLSPLPDPPRDPTNRFADDPAAARLGQYLYFDHRLSRNLEVSCATCHDPEHAFGDGKTLGEGNQVGTRHSPTILNVAYNRWFFWDGRADSLWSQALAPIEAAHEMNGSRLRVARLILEDVEIRRAFEEVFGSVDLVADQWPSDAKPLPENPNDPDHRAWISLDGNVRDEIDSIFVSVGKSIAAYERLLLSRNSPFDRFALGLKHDDASSLDAIDDSAKRGLKIFLGKGNCRLCHSGPHFSDGEFHGIRVAPQKSLSRDSGRYEGITKVKQSPFNALSRFSDERKGPGAMMVQQLRRKPENWGEFKTPTLRNVAVTAPYMHQGQFESLERVLLHYSTFEGALTTGHHGETILKPLNLDPEEITDLISFLETLTDLNLDLSLLKKPQSPSL